MAQLEWLAATLSPSDIAPHPNFFSSEQITEASIFALVCSARWSDIDRAKEMASGLDFTAIYLARGALAVGESRQAADRISELVRNWSQENDSAKYTALTLIASMAYCDLDIYQAAFDLLNFVIERLEQDRSPDDELLLAALYQQLALRQYDYSAGDASVESAAHARSYIANLDVASLSTFPLSQGVGWSSVTTLNDISQAIADASQSLLLSSRGPFPEGWQDAVRSRPGYLDLKALRSTAEAFGHFVNDLFEARLPSGGIIFSQSSADNDLYASLLSEELLGHPSARSARNELGKVRFLEGVEKQELWLIIESINLLRHGRDYRRLRTVVSHVRGAGPLSALATCAGQIMTERDPDSFSLGELIVLRAGADQLDAETAASYLPKITRIFERAQSFAVQDLALMEEAFLAAAEFANVAESPTGFAGSMFRLFQRLRDQELYEMAIVRALQAYDISKATDQEKTAWTEWLNEQDTRKLPDVAASFIGLIFDSEVVPGSQVGSTVTLQSVASYVDRWRRHGRQIPSKVIDEAVPILVDHLKSIQEDAHRGLFSGTMIDAGAAAVTVAQYSGRPELWSELGSFLSDASVQRSDTRNAFEFIANDPDSVPGAMREQLAANRSAVLYSAPELLSSIKVSPYPSALNSFIALRIMEVPAIITEISALAGSDIEMARAAACVALAVYVSNVDKRSTWISVLALQLSKDRSATVRAQAGRVLAALLGEQGELEQLMRIRINALLGEDGLTVPLNLLRELSGSGLALDPQLISRISQLATGSVSAYVRKAATKLWDEQRDLT
jgi:hypothetical protein